MASMTFLINDASTAEEGQECPMVYVTISENLDPFGNPDGTLSFKIEVVGDYTGDLRGLFFDVADESLIGSMSVVNASYETIDTVDGSNLKVDDVVQGEAVLDLGQGANMNGLLGEGEGYLDKDEGYNMGIEIGTQGVGKGDDLQVYTFTLDSSLRDLTLADFSQVNFGVRLTSVGDIGGIRDDSCKLGETTFKVVTPIPDVTECVDEDAILSGNVLTNDRDGLSPEDILSVTSWRGDGHAYMAAGFVHDLTDAEGATLVLNADGSYTLDANAADALSEGEELVYTFTYNILQTNDNDSATASSTLTVTVCGVNDGPIANDDDISEGGTNCILEGAPYNGASVLGNDTDVDRLDTMSVVAINGVKDGEAGDMDGDKGFIKVEIFDGANSLGFVTMKSDGTFVYDQAGKLDGLNDGDDQEVTFDYTMSDNNGAEDSAVVTLCVDGEGGGGGGGGIDFPDLNQNLSNIVFYADDRTTEGYEIVKFKFDAGQLENPTNDIDSLNLDTWMSENYADFDILGFTIHAGTEFTSNWDTITLPMLLDGYNVPIEFHEGEGVFFLNDGNIAPYSNAIPNIPPPDPAPDTIEQEELADGALIQDLADNDGSSTLGLLGFTAATFDSGAYTPIIII